jgi:hypothetical protein
MVVDHREKKLFQILDCIDELPRAPKHTSTRTRQGSPPSRWLQPRIGLRAAIVCKRAPDGARKPDGRDAGAKSHYRMRTAATSLAWLALSLAYGSCGPQGCGKTVKRTPTSASVARPAFDLCSLQLGAAREATRDELLGLLLPEFHAGSEQLPVHHPQATSDRPDVTGVFLVRPCRGEAMESLSPPVIGELQRLPLGDGRELVQFPVGTKEGLAEYTLGVLALLEREGPTLRALGVWEAAADLPGGLAPFRRARVGDMELLLRSEATNPAGEDDERGTYVSIDRLQGNELRLVGTMWERRESDDTFWRGAFAWQMTSPGVEQTATGYVVHEHWSFTQRKTHRRSSRDVRRVYTIVDHLLVEDPRDDLEAWPETRSASSAK